MKDSAASIREAAVHLPGCKTRTPKVSQGATALMIRRSYEGDCGDYSDPLAATSLIVNVVALRAASRSGRRTRA